MKKILLAIFAIALFGSFANATRYMCIKLNSGETLYYPVDNIVDANVDKCELPANEVGGFEYVDLGLPSGLLWATHNIGAFESYEYGDYFAYGETTTKDKYFIDNAAWYGGLSDRYKKASDFFVENNDTILKFEDDAAYVNWGNDWRMPTFRDQQELIDGCTWEWKENYQESGINGILGTSKVNRNTIFFPAGGNKLTAENYYYDWYNPENSTWYENGMVVMGASTHKYGDGVQWKCEIIAFSDGNKVVWYGHSHNPGYEDYYNPGVSSGVNIRPVVNKSCRVMFVDTYANKKYDVYVPQGGIAVAPVSPSMPGKEFVGWSNSTDRVKEDMTVYSMFSDLVTISGSVGKYNYVDLGLPSGTKWATYNMGATNAAEYGDKFAWGETKTKEKYTQENYKWWDAEISRYTKYANYTDKKTELDPEDDAAAVNWGEGWRMPTKEEMDELLAACTWVLTENYKGSGVAGLVGTSLANGATIFFPRKGNRELYLESTQIEGYQCARVNSLLVGSKLSICDNYQINREEGAYIRPVVK
ncbi:MAG: hypothetical protein MJZ19_11355 [Paludibacteraceae bacterium]|nr:hypothetical protein [Paludibacteraceae bacterium]